MPKIQTTTTTTTSTSARAAAVDVTSSQSEQSLGPNLLSRLEALEAAMGVRLNVAKRQGRQSLSNTTTSSPMQISPTSTSSTTISTTATTSLSTTSRHNIPVRSGQGVQRSASSCDVENRPGPSKRLKPSLPMEPSSSSTASAIATIKKYTYPVRRPIPTIVPPTRLTQPKQSTSVKQRSSPMDTVSIRPSRSSTVHNNNTNTRIPIRNSPKMSHKSSTKQVAVTSSSPPPPPPPPTRPATLPRKQRLSIFGEQFSADILKINLLWINLNEFDDEARTEVLIQFGSIENFLREQELFSDKRQQQVKLAARNKAVASRSRLALSFPKKDRLELL